MGNEKISDRGTARLMGEQFGEQLGLAIKHKTPFEPMRTVRTASRVAHISIAYDYRGHFKDALIEAATFHFPSLDTYEGVMFEINNIY